MEGKFRTITVPREEALRVYNLYRLQWATVLNGPMKEVNDMRDLTVSETDRRIADIMAGPDTVTVDMIYDYPLDVVNYNLRLAGDPEEVPPATVS